MVTINYQKRKNLELFRKFEQPNTLFLSKTQNYIPIYNRFFLLNDTNYNNINFNNKWYITNISENTHNENMFICNIKNITTNKVKKCDVFFKIAPLLDPYKYMIGKYELNEKLFNLPNFENKNCLPKVNDPNNAAYVDSLFLFLTSQLKTEHKFIHGVEYYGSFLGIKNKFKINVFDDIEYLINSAFFNKNKNILFEIDEYEYLFQEEVKKLKPLKIGSNISLKTIDTLNDNDKIDLFDNSIDLNDIKNMSLDLFEFTKMNNSNLEDENVTLKSNSSASCSSRSSYTNDYDLKESTHSTDDDDINYNNNDDDEHDNDDDDNDDNDDNNDNDDNDNNDNEEIINVVIPKFPVQVICMEYCENTFDDLIMKNNLTNDEWYSSLMQIIMILITYQKVFNFTHNDLHTNNVMYDTTDKQYLYYCYKKKIYRVPTYGRIFKIIDFGRSIYKFNGKLFCSDSFQNGGDASTQYNTEPYFNDKKPRLDPNFSFDLCRLACSIFDNLIEDLEEIKNINKIDNPIKKLICEWCQDDKGNNMLYKNNGVERYPEFKLYKMIARCVHNHTPQIQLQRAEFSQFEINNDNIKNIDEIINIDNLPILSNFYT